MTTHGFEKVRGGTYCHVEMLKPPACISKAMHYASYRGSKDGEGCNSLPSDVLSVHQT